MPPRSAAPPELANSLNRNTNATISLIYLAGLVVIWFAPETRGKPLPE
jgi:hypothetical protein